MRDRDQRPHLYWGDIHRQTNWTCGEGSPDDHFKAAKEHFGMDFAAVTDNARVEDPTERLFPGENLLQHRHFLPGQAAHSITLDQWKTTQEAVQRHNKDGEFAAFLGYEWCSVRYGDHNVYYTEDEGPLYLPERLEDLYQGCGIDQPRMIIPHHTGYARGRRGVNWNVHHRRLERVVEIHSTQHGCSEGSLNSTHPLYSRSMGSLVHASSVQTALDRGYKLGFTGGSDSHYLTQKSGITGVFAQELTRKELFSGLWHRRTIASTGPKFAAWFTVGGYFVGSMVTLDYLPQVEIETESAEWLQAELVRNGEVIQKWANSGGQTHLTYQEQSEGLIPDNYYYVRIVLPEDEMVWISPVWVSYLSDTEFAQDTLYWLPEVDTLFWGRILGEDQVALKIMNTPRSPGCITAMEFQALDENGRVVANQLAADQTLTPGELATVVLNVPAGQTGRLTYRVRYADHHDDIRTIHRTRILKQDEESVFALER